MIKTTVTISNKLGLHARASAKLTKLAGSFPCEVWIAKGERRVNAKSIMGVMMLAAGLGSEVTLWGLPQKSNDSGQALAGVAIDEVAQSAGTVGYELMCALAARVPVVVKD